ncbi:MAG: DNA gyrase subunit A, partial [Proteobacteria bacterium]|nr:DNA gyrase subunit A [Pseudomonadota bacterium]
TSDESKAYIKKSRKDDDDVEDTNFEISQKKFDELKIKEEFILTVTENGYGKRSSSYEFRESGRGGQGIINIITSERNGNVAASYSVKNDDDIMLITNSGQMIRCKVSDIRIAGRNTQGVRIFKVEDNDKVVSSVCLSDETEE